MVLANLYASILRKIKYAHLKISEENIHPLISAGFYRSQGR